MGPGNYNRPKILKLPVTERQLTLLINAVTMKVHSTGLEEFVLLKKHLELQKKILTENKKPRM